MSTVPRDVGSPGRFRPSYHLDQKKFGYDRGNDLYDTSPSHASPVALLLCALKLSDPFLEVRHPEMIFLFPAIYLQTSGNALRDFESLPQSPISASTQVIVVSLNHNYARS